MSFGSKIFILIFARRIDCFAELLNKFWFSYISGLRDLSNIKGHWSNQVSLVRELGKIVASSFQSLNEGDLEPKQTIIQTLLINTNTFQCCTTFPCLYSQPHRIFQNILTSYSPLLPLDGGRWTAVPGDYIRAVSTVMGDGEGVVDKSKGVYGAGTVTTTTTPPNLRHNDQSR